MSGLEASRINGVIDVSGPALERLSAALEPGVGPDAANAAMGIATKEVR